jgi:predicted GNAT family N-acyltransferase
MAHGAQFSLRFAMWADDCAALSAIRAEVFIVEQHVPPELEWDGLDNGCLHVLALSSSDEPIGCGRLLFEGIIGRMAVLKDWRRKGVGSAILQALVSKANAFQLDRVYLHAQTQVASFYEQHGFERIGEKFIEAGIPHVKMIKPL